MNLSIFGLPVFVLDDVPNNTAIMGGPMTSEGNLKMAKTASQLLIDSGLYSEVQTGLFAPVRPSSEHWEKTEGGWHCYTRPTLSIGGGEPWGKVLDGGLMQLPFSQAPAFAEASGLHPARNPEAYIWEWPEERLVEIYTYASPDGDNPWRKTDEGKFVKSI